MKYLLLPQSHLGAELDTSEAWAVTFDIDLGGYFYDRIHDADGNLAGVRYWIEQGVVFSVHPVFSLFQNDKRFNFNQAENYVDIFFEEKNTEAFRESRLTIENTQDFGGDEVVQCGGLFGISFNL